MDGKDGGEYAAFTGKSSVFTALTDTVTAVLAVALDIERARTLTVLGDLVSANNVLAECLEHLAGAVRANLTVQQAIGRLRQESVAVAEIDSSTSGADLAAVCRVLVRQGKIPPGSWPILVNRLTDDGPDGSWQLQLQVARNLARLLDRLVHAVQAIHAAGEGATLEMLLIPLEEPVTCQQLIMLTVTEALFLYSAYMCDDALTTEAFLAHHATGSMITSLASPARPGQ